MCRAELLVEQLLEGYEPLAAPGAVYVLSGGSGQMFQSLDDYAQRVGAGAQEATAPVIADQLKRGTVIVRQPVLGKLIVYSKNFPVPVTTAQLEQMQAEFNTPFPATIAWAKSLDIRPIGLPFRKVFGAAKAMDRAEKQKEKLAKQAEKADKQAKKLAKSTEAEHSGWFNHPEWKKEFEQGFGVNPNAINTGYTEKTPEPEQQNPYDLGIKPMKHNRRGVLIGEIVAGSPAASSTLQPGDVIRAVGPFTSRSGDVIGPYRIDKAAELERVLGWLRGGTAFPIKAVRGSGYVEAVVMPRPRQ